MQLQLSYRYFFFFLILVANIMEQSLNSAIAMNIRSILWNRWINARINSAKAPQAWMHSFHIHTIFYFVNAINPYSIVRLLSELVQNHNICCKTYWKKWWKVKGQFVVALPNEFIHTWVMCILRLAEFCPNEYGLAFIFFYRWFFTEI